MVIPYQSAKFKSATFYCNEQPNLIPPYISGYILLYLVNVDDCLLILLVCSTDWEMRLVNGGNSLEGRLEVCLNGVWGTICDQSWDDTDAGVACSQMGHSARGTNYEIF